MIPVWLIFILVMLGMGMLLLLGTAYMMARALLRPPHMTDGKAAWVLKRLSPGDLSLPFKFQWFHVRDELTGKMLKLASWWMPNHNSMGRTVILVHGYADAKVGAIAWAPLFHSLGFNVFAFDNRAHGESEGDWVSAGFYEQHDLNQVIDQLRAERPNETRRLVLCGLSLGGAIAAAAAVTRNDLAAVILESPVAEERGAAMAQFDLMGLPGRPVQKLALRMTQWITGIQFAGIKPVELIPRIPCPLMIVQAGRDVYVPPEDVAAIRAAAQLRPAAIHADYWLVEDAPHLMAYSLHPEEYRRRVEEFLTGALHYPPFQG